MSALSFLHPALIGMGLHVASVRVRRAVRGHKRYPGQAEDILRAGLADCWSGQYLTASPGTYRQFWTRDTGFASAALVRLGGPWPDRLLSSLAWAIRVWRDRRSHVTTTINPLLRRPVDIFDYGVDSLPLLLSSIRVLTTSMDPTVVARAEGLVDEHRDWIAAEVQHFVEQVVDPATGLVRTDRTFSAHRDTFKNGSTAYANTMAALLARTVAETGWGPDLLSRHFVFADSDAAIDMPALMPVARIRTGPGSPPNAGPGSPPNAGPDSPPNAGPDSPPKAGPDSPPKARIPPTRIAEDVSPPAGGFGHTSVERGWHPGRIGRVERIGHAERIRHDGKAPDWGLLLKRHFWLGDRFRDRLGTDETSGEANVWPFFAGVIEDREMVASALATLRREGYTTPYPLRFEAAHRTDGLLLAYRLWSPDYQTTTSWTSLGSIYLSLLRQVDPAAATLELERMRRLIERDGTFWEVLDASGRPWRSRSGLSVSDVSMLWGANLLEALISA